MCSFSKCCFYIFQKTLVYSNLVSLRQVQDMTDTKCCLKPWFGYECVNLTVFLLVWQNSMVCQTECLIFFSNFQEVWFNIKISAHKYFWDFKVFTKYLFNIRSRSCLLLYLSCIAFLGDAKYLFRRNYWLQSFMYK